jgi:hypothetical protein
MFISLERLNLTEYKATKDEVARYVHEIAKS